MYNLFYKDLSLVKSALKNLSSLHNLTQLFPYLLVIMIVNILKVTLCRILYESAYKLAVDFAEDFSRLQKCKTCLLPCK